LWRARPLPRHPSVPRAPPPRPPPPCVASPLTPLPRSSLVGAHLRLVVLPHVAPPVTRTPSSSAMSSTHHAVGAGARGAGSRARQDRGASCWSSARRSGELGSVRRGSQAVEARPGWTAGNGSSVKSSSIGSMPISSWRTQNEKWVREKKIGIPLKIP
jgi:hypothetical protein